MPDPSCGDVRAYLNALAAGRAPPANPGVWEVLSRHGAVAGSPAAPQLTDVGRHVLSELEVRAYRTDGSTLPAVADMLNRLLVEFDEVARGAEYFLVDLGPVTPDSALPLLRPVSIGLANRRETPEELAKEFRGVWGGLEVMGGDPRDQLLAAELLNASAAEMEKVYSPIMSTTERIRSKLGPRASSVTPATILHLTAGPEAAVSLDDYFSLRAKSGSDEAAALLAALSTDAAAALARRDGILAALGAPGASPDALHAATFLAAVGADAQGTARTRQIADELGKRIGDPLTPAALLSTHATLSPAEIVNWLDKAIQIVTNHQLAPSPPEVAALAVAMVHGLPEAEFLSPTPMGQRPAPAPASLPALTAIHAWMYRPLVGPAGAVSAPARAA